MRHLIALFVFTMALSSAHAGDADKGKAIALEKGCAGCHGVDGNSPSNQWPKIAGQGEKYLISQLKAFRTNDLKDEKTGGRVDAVMAGSAKDLSDEDIENISAYFASQKVKGGKADPALTKLGYQLYRGGDKNRGIPSCMGCHGPSGAGNPAAGYPSLAGQWAAYTEKQLLAFKSWDRRNDMNKMMRDIAKELSPEEITAVSSVIQGLHD